MSAGLHKALKLSHHSHTGKRLPRHTTSYGVLLVLVLVMGVTLAIGTKAALAAQQTVNSAITARGVMPGPPPVNPAIIVKPINGSRTGSQVVEVSGRCAGDTLVQIFKNGLFAGVAQCEGGLFHLNIDLVVGKNVLVAKIVDKLSQYGPDSSPVTVYFDPTLVLTNQLILTSDTPTQGTAANQAAGLDLLVQGGTAPFAVSIEWGDGGKSLVPRSSNGAFTVNHTYKYGGVYTVTATATDAAGHTAHLQTIIIVQGSQTPPIAGTGSGTPPEINFYVAPSFAIIWPLYLLLLALVLAFWLGEKNEFLKLKKQHRLLSKSAH